MPYRHLVLVLTFAFPCHALADWPQWGGPQRNFEVAGVTLADRWPEAGPRQIWRRPLGDGYSSVVSVKGQLFTTHRHNGREHISALDAKTGETVWQHHYNAQFLEGTNVEQFGPGPLSTPLVVNDRIYTVGLTGVLHCLDTREGTVHWRRNLIDDLGGTNLYRGYSASPIAYQDTVILPVGGQGRGIVAFRLSDGSVVWQKQDFAISHVSPILIRLADNDQLVVLAEELITGIDPSTGALLWQYGHGIDGGYVSSTPVWGEDGRLFFSAAYGEGSRCLLLKPAEGRTNVSEIWHSGRMRVHHSNVIRVGDVAFGSSGDFSTLLFTAVDMSTGELLWKDRELGRANGIYVDDKFILLREDGTLMLATMTRKELTVRSTAKLFEGRAWTAPSLDGNRLFIRNREEVMAFELP